MDSPAFPSRPFSSRKAGSRIASGGGICWFTMCPWPEHPLYPHQRAIHHCDEAERVPVKHLDLGKNAASAMALLITWLLGFGFTECFLSSAQRRRGRRVCHYRLLGEKEEHQGMEGIC